MTTLRLNFAVGKVDRIDAEAGTIYGVSVITTGVARGHGVFIDDTTLAQVAALMNEMGQVKVKATHWSDFKDIVGSLADARVDGDRVRADFSLIKSHELYPVILELTEKQPETFGFSIAFSGVPEEKDKLLYARVTELYSVDLVDSPAANPSGLFQSTGGNTHTDKKTMIDTILAKLGGFDERFAALHADIEKVTNSHTKLEEQNRQLTTNLATVTTERDQFSAKVAELTAEVEKLKASVPAQAAAQALDIVAAQGAAPVASGAPASTPGSGNTDFSARLQACKTAGERAAFLKAHRAEIYAERDAMKRAEEAEAAEKAKRR